MLSVWRDQVNRGWCGIIAVISLVMNDIRDKSSSIWLQEGPEAKSL